MGCETRKQSLWESMKRQLFGSLLYFPPWRPHFKNDWLGLPPLCNESTPFNAQSPWRACEARAGFGGSRGLCHPPRFLYPFGRRGSCSTPTGGRAGNLGLSTVHMQEQHHLMRSASKIFKEQIWFTIKYGEMEIRLGSYQKM